MDTDGCLRPSNTAGLDRHQQIGQCDWTPYPAEAPAITNPYMLEAKNQGKSMLDLNPVKDLNNPLDKSSSIVYPIASSDSCAPTDSGFITANAVDSRAEFPTLAPTEDVSAPPADIANPFMLSNGGDGGGLFILGRRRVIAVSITQPLQMALERNAPH